MRWIGFIGIGERSLRARQVREMKRLVRSEMAGSEQDFEQDRLAGE